MVRSHTQRQVWVQIPLPWDFPMDTVIWCRKFTLDQNRDRYQSLIGYCTHFWDRAPSPGEVSVYVNEPLKIKRNLFTSSITPLGHLSACKLKKSFKNTLIVSGKKLLQAENNKGETVMDLACTEEMKLILTTTTQQSNIPYTPTKSRPDSQGINYRPHPNDGEGYVFTGVCLLTEGGGGLLHLHP